ncbi:MAG: response regulator [Lachnospiraceae bacterium]|nr:response regulator [Lachnospiraceae bacterium]
MENSNKPHIVAIDDSIFVCETLSTWLKGKYDIITFTNGKDGLSYLENADADLVFLDYEMPDMTGYQVLMGIRSNLKINKIPVIFLTAETNDRMEAEMLERGANHYIRKPLELSVLNSALANHLRKKI